MVRVVADTNIFISALMFGGLPGSFLDLAFLRLFQLVTSPSLLDELDEKLRGKFEVLPEDATRIRERLESCDADSGDVDQGYRVKAIRVPAIPIKVGAQRRWRD